MNAESDGFTPAMQAVTEGSARCLKMLIQAGAKLNLADDQGQTALMIAVAEGESQCARLLIKAGADTEAKDYHGHTAACYAYTRGDVESLALLLKAGCDLDVINALGMRGRDYSGQVAEERARREKVAISSAKRAPKRSAAPARI